MTDLTIEREILARHAALPETLIDRHALRLRTFLPDGDGWRLVEEIGLQQVVPPGHFLHRTLGVAGKLTALDLRTALDPHAPTRALTQLRFVPECSKQQPLSFVYFYVGATETAKLEAWEFGWWDRDNRALHPFFKDHLPRLRHNHR